MQKDYCLFWEFLLLPGFNQEGGLSEESARARRRNTRFRKIPKLHACKDFSVSNIIKAIPKAETTKDFINSVSSSNSQEKRKGEERRKEEGFSFKTGNLQIKALHLNVCIM